MTFLLFFLLHHLCQRHHFPPSSTLRCRGLFQGFPPCQLYSAPPVYPEASPFPIYPVYPALTYPASPGGCLFRGPSPWQLYLRLLGGCCRTAALCWTTRLPEVTFNWCWCWCPSWTQSFFSSVFATMCASSKQQYHYVVVWTLKYGKSYQKDQNSPLPGSCKSSKTLSGTAHSSTAFGACLI